ncbi:SDR family NAD(P)-dependent oxidoreductase [Fibrisoma montanum]|uniref:SDR family NAD(P)-dependent oxidoreductase n=1 Tax=Fibrisoma montanum TaxID=2305895 RepID=A0A418M5T5_9BACT|nr:SDR family NAD(P)-dependent oxidoreductase [Fibrisoma montanum]RIV21319.1 SDR family NAD(P)-dependent oxidoreductase [Fibrisoma montanum]
MSNVVIITGASSGIGKESARLFARHGYRVFATARNVERMKDLAALGCVMIPMDVTDEESIQQAFKQIYAQTSRVDVLVNNAGFSQNGFFEELTPQHLRYQFEVNVFGLVRVTQMVLPIMRKARQGRIINVGSVGGDFTTAGASAYHASKYALESLTDGLRQEMKNFGIDVVLVKPGGVETEFINNAASFYPEPIAGNPYGAMREKFLKMTETILDSTNSSFPILKATEVAKAIFDSTTASQPRTRVRVGRTARMIPLMKGVLSDRAFDNMIMGQLGLNK